MFPIYNEVFSGEQEKKSIFRVGMGYKYPSLVIAVCHYSARLVMPVCDPQDRFLGSYILTFNLLLKMRQLAKITTSSRRHNVIVERIFLQRNHW